MNIELTDEEAVARRYGLHPSQLFAWRKAAREGNTEEAGSGWFACAFAPIVVSGSPLPPSGCGRMEIVLGSGRRIAVDASVDSAALDRVINLLERR